MDTVPRGNGVPPESQVNLYNQKTKNQTYKRCVPPEKSRKGHTPHCIDGIILVVSTVVYECQVSTSPAPFASHQGWADSFRCSSARGTGASSEAHAILLVQPHGLREAAVPKRESQVDCRKETTLYRGGCNNYNALLVRKLLDCRNISVH